MIGTVEILSIPASCNLLVRMNQNNSGREAYAGKMMVWRIILQDGSAGMSTVSVPVHGAPPTKVLSLVDVQHR